MRPILPLHALVVHQAHIRLIDQSSCLQTVADSLGAHVAPRQAVELGIDDGRQLLQGALVSISPGAQELADVGGKAKHIVNEANRRASVRSPCISVCARRWTRSSSVRQRAAH